MNYKNLSVSVLTDIKTKLESQKLQLENCIIELVFTSFEEYTSLIKEYSDQIDNLTLVITIIDNELLNRETF